MSTAYALAAVTAVLCSRLRARIAEADLTVRSSEIAVSALPPDRITVGAQEPAQLNLFLYQVTPNHGWNNVAMPAAAPTGGPLNAPPLGLDLHYLLTVYGAEAYVGEIILGHALQALHDEAVLTRDVIRKALDPDLTDQSLPKELKEAGLADQLELVRLTPTTMSSEEVSKLWSALQAHYRPSATYTAHVVVIDSKRPRRPALPVAGLAASSTVRPQLPPVLDAVMNSGAGGVITPDSTIVLRGRGLGGNGLVLLGGFGYRPTAAEVTESAITVPLATAAPALRAGVVPAQVRMEVPVSVPRPEGSPMPAGEETAEVTVYPSNGVSFLLAPVVTATAQVSGTETVNGVPLVSGTVTVTVTPRVTATQHVTLLLNEIGAPAGRRAFGIAIAAPKDNGVTTGGTDTATITFGFKKVPKGRYVVRLSVDGAESALGRDSRTGLYKSPGVDL
ncbi:DUF4255 domain-containing protein [Streptomyces sp. ISL-36]|uniref:DUF4255 domain-containing protein n=1 Tax=Streptomyces sp. ISL-36 TaxID=2819182 RepID=UPI001BE7B223|nr:DUF4255 domain-containing protein [Streptomyces sp. ISL-36]MBT2442709.1 DUF4255 domain-containing protein [Streptomyces sp. ISL-36]